MSYLGRSAKLSLKAQEKVSFLATAGQTSKTGLSYTPSFIEVYVNGVLLTDTTDFTATNGNSITFTVALLLNDEVTVISLKTFTVADHYSKTEADTLLAAKATNTALATTNTAVALKAPIASPSFTGTVSGADDFISTKAGGVFLKNTSGGTSGTQIMIANTGGSMRAGVESSAGNAVQANTLPYAAVFGNQGNYPTQFTTNGTTRMTIDGGGQVMLGRTTAAGGYGATFYPTGSANNMVVVYNKDYNGGSVVMFFQTLGTTVGTIQSSASATSYNTSSDYRLKTDVQPMTGAADRVKLLKPCNFEWINTGERVDGFLAHEAQEVVPESVTGTKDAMKDEEYEVTPAVLDDEGNETTAAVMGTRSVPDMQGIDQAKLVPLLTATIQELIARIEALEGE